MERGGSVHRLVRLQGSKHGESDRAGERDEALRDAHPLGEMIDEHVPRVGLP